VLSLENLGSWASSPVFFPPCVIFFRLVRSLLSLRFFSAVSVQYFCAFRLVSGHHFLRRDRDAPWPPCEFFPVGPVPSHTLLFPFADSFQRITPLPCFRFTKLLDSFPPCGPCHPAGARPVSPIGSLFFLFFASFALLFPRSPGRTTTSLRRFLLLSFSIPRPSFFSSCTIVFLPDRIGGYHLGGRFPRLVSFPLPLTHFPL